MNVISLTILLFEGEKKQRPLYILYYCTVCVLVVQVLGRWHLLFCVLVRGMFLIYTYLVRRLACHVVGVPSLSRYNKASFFLSLVQSRPSVRPITPERRMFVRNFFLETEKLGCSFCYCIKINSRCVLLGRTIQQQVFYKSFDKVPITHLI